ncbi:MAG TPA: ribosome maturation factor RimM [Thermoanaerobaculia bacterium]
MSSTSSKTSEPPAAPAAPAATPETIVVGRILRPHGLRGEAIVEVLTDAPRRFDPGSSLLLVREGRPEVALVVASRRAASAPGRPPGGGRARQATALVRFAGIGDREAAVALRGGWLEVERSLVPPAPVGTYYRFELLGCRCSDGGEDLGKVVEVVEDGGGLLLIVADGRREVPVPFVARFLRAVDVEHGRIELDLPPGLIEACASRS